MNASDKTNVLYRVTHREDGSKTGIFTVTRQENNGTEERVSVADSLESAIYQTEYASTLLDKCEWTVTLKVDFEMIMSKPHTH